MLCFPNANINIGLNITEKRPDHYHNIETVFYPIPLTDILEILKTDNRTGKKAELVITGMDIPGDMESNLCIKAYHLLERDYHLPSVKIYLHKIIPTGAGLGGGSSDGAFTLTLLNQLFELNLSYQQLNSYAIQLGSDCPFFINNTPAIGTEKGNALKSIELDISGYYFVLIKPPVFIKTAEAYKGVKSRKPEQSVNDLVKLPVTQWKNKVVNDFEQTILVQHPPIKKIKDELYSLGATYAAMTGSGAAVYGLFEKKVDIKNIVGQEFCWAEYL